MSNLSNDTINTLVKKDNCFDFLRYFFAFSLVIVHFCTLSETEQFWIVSGGMRVKAFFIMSGFLVFNSYIKRPMLKDYIKKRFKRIYPAYFLVIILCLFLGAFLTNLSIKYYFNSTETYKYIISNLSFLNFIQPELPGVFLNNPTQPVNGSLWSMKVEVLFYISVPIIFYLLRRYNKLAIMIGIFLFSVAYNEYFIYLYEKTNNELYNIIRRQIGSQLIYFYSGTFILLYFDIFIKYLKYILPLSILLYIFKDKNIVFSYLESFSFASILIGIAYSLTFLNFLRKYDNISYGIYLYHYPIIQTVVHFQLHKYNIYLAVIVVFISTISVALASWYLFEKPIINGTFGTSVSKLSLIKKRIG